MTERDHLFVNYATENGQFAEWLTLKLTAEGYRVWCDRFELLGGESYPADIEDAIRTRTFRMLSVLSPESLHKPNPLKERTLALNLARERHEDFVLPLNMGLPAADIPWTLSDLTFIPFNSWADGFARLLKKLESIDAPRPLADGKQIVTDWVHEQQGVSQRPERLWTNLLELCELPEQLLRITFNSTPPRDLHAEWVAYRQSETVYWAFEVPDAISSLPVEIETFRWRERHPQIRMRLPNVVTTLIGKHLEAHCLRLGMQRSPDGEYLYFPPGLLPNDRLTFQGYERKGTWLLVSGVRRFRLGAQSEQSRYHLSPRFRPNLWKYGRPVVQLQMRLYLTDLEGRRLPPAVAARRRKAVGKAWWNHQWLMRVLGVASWIAGGNDEVNLALTSECRIMLSGRPVRLIAPVGISEGDVPTEDPDDDVEFLEELDADGEEDNTNGSAND